MQAMPPLIAYAPTVVKPLWLPCMCQDPNYNCRSTPTEV